MLPPAPRPDPGKWKAVALTVLMHALLVAALFFGIRWQNREPEPVAVEVWRASPEPPAPPVEPVTKPEPVPAPKEEPPPPPKPEIAVKAEKPEPKKPEAKKPEAKKPEPRKPEAKKPELPRLNFDEAMRREQEQLDRDKELQEKQKRAEQEARAILQAQADQAAAVRAKGLADYVSRIQGKIRGNLVQPLDLKGNPVAVFTVTQLPTGEVLDVQIKRSSASHAYDEAIERAIRKSSPLPRPADAKFFARQLELKFCPNDPCP